MGKLIQLMADLPKDKLLHSFYGVLIYLVAALVSPLFGIIAVVVIAIAKEIYDELDYGGLNYGDIAMTVLIPTILFIKEYYFLLNR